MSNVNSGYTAAVTSAKDLAVVFYRVKIKGKANKTKVKELSEKAESENGATAGTVTSLVIRIPDILAKPIKRIEGQIRNLFYAEGICMGDGYGIPICVLPSFKAKLDALRQEYTLHYSKLLESAENGEMQRILVAESGALIDSINPPTVEQIRHGYGVVVETFAELESPQVAQAMALLTEELKASVAKDVEETLKAESAMQLAASSQKVVEEVAELLCRVREACGAVDVKGIQFKTLTDRFERVCKVLPNYNLTNDPKLTDLLDSVRTAFGETTKEVLKADPEARKRAIEKADEIAKGFASMF